MATEKRLIDLDDLLEECEDSIAYGETDNSPAAPYTVAAIKGLAKYLKTCPTVDAVEVVRCRECCFGKGELICTNPKCTKSFFGCPVPPEHFCSYGERREGE